MSPHPPWCVVLRGNSAAHLTSFLFAGKPLSGFQGVAECCRSQDAAHSESSSHLRGESRTNRHSGAVSLARARLRTVPHRRWSATVTLEGAHRGSRRKEAQSRF